MSDQLALFANDAPQRYLGTGDHNGELVVTEVERFERKGEKWMRGRIVAHHPAFDKWLRPIGGIAAGRVKEWKELED